MTVRRDRRRVGKGKEAFRVLLRLTRMNACAYVAILRVIVTERLWCAPTHVTRPRSSGEGRDRDYAEVRR